MYCNYMHLGNPPDRKLRVIHLGVCTDHSVSLWPTPWVFLQLATMLPTKDELPSGNGLT